MAVYRFQTAYPVHSVLPRDYFANTFHMNHLAGGITATDLNSICDSINDMFATRLGAATGREVRTKCYEVPHAKPNPPVADRVKSLGTPWTPTTNCEVAICLSFAGNPSLPRERGRMYFSPGMCRQTTPAGLTTIGIRPTSAQMQWALDFYSVANASFPDLGGVDWEFGVWSPTNNAFVKATKAWVDDEWDTVRSRGLRESTRISSVREG